MAVSRRRHGKRRCPFHRFWPSSFQSLISSFQSFLSFPSFPSFPMLSPIFFPRRMLSNNPIPIPSPFPILCGGGAKAHAFTLWPTNRELYL